MTKRPQYEALDTLGLPYVREAREIHELPHSDRNAALKQATTTIEQMLGMKACHPVSFGLPVFESFMRSADANKHAQRALLMTQGCHLSLDLCPSYN